MTRGRLVAAVSLVLFFGRPAAAQTDAQPPAAPDPAIVLGPPKGPVLSGPPLEKRTEEVAALLRCPVCQGLSVADSPASMALNMKAQVKDLLAKGYDQDQILAYFESSYGEFVRLEPPLRGVNWLVWLAPLLGLAAGGYVVVWALRRSARAPEPAPADLPGVRTLPDDPRLAAYVLKVRELAYGWPGGVPPEATS